jgi:D-amino peptidase
MKEESMRKTRGFWTAVLAVAALGTPVFAQAEPYELSKNDVMDPKSISSENISLFGVKLGDPEAKALDVLVN